MYAIVDIAGQQFKVQKEQEICVHRLEGEEGTSVQFEKVLLLDDDGKVSVGKPFVEGISVSAKIINHLKGDKVLVFKKKRRKSYQKCNGHRQYFTKVLIEDIAAPKAKTSRKAKAEPKADKTNDVVENNAE